MTEQSPPDEEILSRFLSSIARLQALVENPSAAPGIGALLNVKGAVYMLALTAASVSAVRAGFPEAATQIPIWGFLLVGSVVACGLLLGNVRSAQSGGRGESR